MAKTMNLATQQQALSGASLVRSSRVQRPFVARPRMVVSAAHQGPNDAIMKTFGAIAAAQIALLPLSGAALAANPLAPNPVETLQARTKDAAKNAKAVANKAGVPDPARAFEQKAKQASKAVGNPAKEFAAKAEKNVKKVSTKGPSLPSAGRAKAAVVNPAKEFAAKAQKQKKKLPLASLGFSYGDLQQEVLFGFGEKKAEKVANKAGDAADSAKGAVKGAAQEAQDATPDSFSIFDADSVSDARKSLKENLDKAVNTKSDPAERVVSVGKPGESQEDNAERIRREAENGPVSGGDARAPTN